MQLRMAREEKEMSAEQSRRLAQLRAKLTEEWVAQEKRESDLYDERLRKLRNRLNSELAEQIASDTHGNEATEKEELFLGQAKNSKASSFGGGHAESSTLFLSDDETESNGQKRRPAGSKRTTQDEPAMDSSLVALDLSVHNNDNLQITSDDEIDIRASHHTGSSRSRRHASRNRNGNGFVIDSPEETLLEIAKRFLKQQRRYLRDRQGLIEKARYATARFQGDGWD